MTTNVTREAYNAALDRDDGECETATEMLERKLFFARKLHASQEAARLGFERGDEGASFDAELLEHYTHQIVDLRIALSALYARE